MTLGAAAILAALRQQRPEVVTLVLANVVSFLNDLASFIDDREGGTSAEGVAAEIWLRLDGEVPSGKDKDLIGGILEALFGPKKPPKPPEPGSEYDFSCLPECPDENPDILAARAGQKLGSDSWGRDLAFTSWLGGHKGICFRSLGRIPDCDKKGQQCCYNEKTGKLITSGAAGGGTADGTGTMTDDDEDTGRGKQEDIGDIIDHFFGDVVSYLGALVTGQKAKYYARYPTSQGGGASGTNPNRPQSGGGR